MPTDLLISILVVLLVLVLFAAAFLIVRAMLFGKLPAPVEPFALAEVEGRLVAEHLAEALRHQTVAEFTEDMPGLEALENAQPGPAFSALHRALERMYPRLHAALKRERVGSASLLYTWAGRSAELEPVLLCAHLDVAPVDPETRAAWTHAPFAGDVADGFVWGRGALDMKGVLVSIFEAVEGLIRAGYQPERTLYIALGQDEETGGVQGARQIAGLLAERGVRLAVVLDEGAAVTVGLVPGMAVPAALIGVAEKGYATYELKVEGRAGHSSMPPRHTAVGVLARAVTRVEESPLPPRLSLLRLTFGALGAFLPFGMRMGLANPGLFGGALRRRLAAVPEAAALTRTTIAVTMIGGGVKDNVLPAVARAAVNCRLLPGDTRTSVHEHLRRAVNDEAVQISLDEARSWEAAPVSPRDGPVYNALEQTIRRVFPDAAVAPYLVLAATDARYYSTICPAVYRFAPMQLDASLLHSIHGVDERIAVDDMARMVAFYHLLIQTWAGE